MKTTPDKAARAIVLLVVAVCAAAIGLAAGMHLHAHPDAPSPAQSAPVGPKQLWTCSMHPQVIQDHPGQCPICHMQLTPIAAPSKSGNNPSAGQVTIDPAVVQNMGLRTAPAFEGTLSRTIRLPGQLVEAEVNARDITPRVSGYVSRLHANFVGMELQPGEPLFDLYSPELSVAIEELINARKLLAAASDQPTRDTASSLYDAAAQKLDALGLERQQIDALAKQDHAPKAVTIFSPIAGEVIEKNIVEGAAVKAGDRALRIVNHTTLWLDAQVYEQDIPYIQMEQKAEATVTARPGEVFAGPVMFIHPHLDPTSHTAMIRMVLKNPDMRLRPGMLATVKIVASLPGRSVLVPREAIIDAGDRQVAFVAHDNTFEPRQVRMGQQGEGGLVQVDGIKAGEQVVTSGQFLLDSESRLRESVERFLSEKSGSQGVSGVPPTSPHTLPEQQRAPVGEVGAQPPTTPASANSLQSSLDQTVAAYLAMSKYLGEVQQTPAALDPSDLIRAATKLAAAAKTTPNAPLTDKALAAAQALKDKKIQEQRELFKPLGDAMVALIKALPPTAAVAPKLYHMHCPMAPGDWLQTQPDMANPFYPDEMKECGTPVEEITPLPKPRASIESSSPVSLTRCLDASCLDAFLPFQPLFAQRTTARGAGEVHQLAFVRVTPCTPWLFLRESA